MADPFIAEIRMVPFHFPPKGWAWCSGQLIPLSQNTALFALLGTTYGGNGKSNFALPNLDGRAPMHPGQGPGLSLHDLGEEGGTEMVKLLESEMPPHSHSIRADGGQSTVNSPEAAFVSATNRPGYATNTGGGKKLNESSISPAGGDQPHNNMMPYLTVHFCIAIQGVFPPRY
jgi:microcystin-dependent protein